MKVKQDISKFLMSGKSSLDDILTYSSKENVYHQIENLRCKDLLSIMLFFYLLTNFAIRILSANAITTNSDGCCWKVYSRERCGGKKSENICTFWLRW